MIEFLIGLVFAAFVYFMISVFNRNFKIVPKETKSSEKQSFSEKETVVTSKAVSITDPCEHTFEQVGWASVTGSPCMRCVKQRIIARDQLSN